MDFDSRDSDRRSSLHQSPAARRVTASTSPVGIISSPVQIRTCDHSPRSLNLRRRNLRAGSALASPSGPFVCRSRISVLTEPAAQIGARRVRQVIVLELAATSMASIESETRRRAIAHRHRHRAVELDDRRRVDPRAARRRVRRSARQSVAPASAASACTAAIAACSVYGPNAARLERALDQRQPSVDLLAVPQRAVLLVEQARALRPETCARRGANRAAASAPAVRSLPAPAAARRRAGQPDGLADRSGRVSDGPDDAE